MEKRHYGRLPISLDVYLVLNQVPMARGKTLNIGPGGMFVYTTPPPAFSGHAEVEIEFTTWIGSGSECTYRIPVTIVYASPDGLGLRFLESDDSDYQVSHTVLGLLCSGERPLVSQVANI